MCVGDFGPIVVVDIVDLSCIVVVGTDMAADTVVGSVDVDFDDIDLVARWCYGFVETRTDYRVDGDECCGRF